MDVGNAAECMEAREPLMRARRSALHSSHATADVD